MQQLPKQNVIYCKTCFLALVVFVCLQYCWEIFIPGYNIGRTKMSHFRVIIHLLKK